MASTDETCLDPECRQGGSGNRNGQLGTGNRVGSTDETCLDPECKQGGSGGRNGQFGSGNRVASTDQTCLDPECRQGGAGNRNRQFGSGTRSQIEAITWSRMNGIIAATIHFADGTSAFLAFEE